MMVSHGCMTYNGYFGRIYLYNLKLLYTHHCMQEDFAVSVFPLEA